jgi:3D (Asp-Asp-Asp) domain-containing protein
MNIFTKHNILTKKEKKILVAAILLSLVHNFVVFPAQAATYDEPTIGITVPSRRIVIKHPKTKTNNLEQFSAKEPLAKPALSFTLVKENKSVTAKASASNLAPVRIALSDIPQGGKHMTVTMTAYNSEVAQTDGDPCTTANGFNVCKHGIEDTVAANFLPMGTQIMIPDYFGDRVFTVRDRTARKYSNRVDVWMLKKSDALQFGKRQLRIVVLAD